MDKMSLVSILAVSVPEIVLNLYMAFLITGEKFNLYLEDKKNIIRLYIAVTLMVIASVALRAFLPNLWLVVLANIIVFPIILKFTYEMRLAKALINVVIMYAFLITVEALFTPIIMVIVGNDLNKMYSSDWLRFLVTLPERAVQIFCIISMWNWKRVWLNLVDYKETQVVFITLIAALFFTEITLIIVFLNNFAIIPPLFRAIWSGGLMVFALVNFYLFKFISVLTNTVVKKEMVKSLGYKERSKASLERVYILLEKGDIDSAKRICKEITF